MKKITPILLAASILVVSASPTFAATAGSDTKDIRVGGHVSPASCDISIDNGGNFDYGNMVSTDLEKRTLSGNMYVLDEIDASLIVQCPHPTKVALKTLDARGGDAQSASGVPTLLGMSANQYYKFALGRDVNGNRIGTYVIGISVKAGDVQVDGAEGYLVARSNPTSPWAAASAGETGVMSNGIGGTHQFSFTSTPNGSTPSLISNVTVKLREQAAVAKNLSSDYEFNGLGTIELVYL